MREVEERCPSGQSIDLTIIGYDFGTTRDKELPYKKMLANCAVKTCYLQVLQDAFAGHESA